MQDQHIEDLSRRLSQGAAATDGIFVKALDDALCSFNVERQAYYSTLGESRKVMATLGKLSCLRCYVGRVSVFTHAQ